MAARAQRRANLGEELVIFGNPFMAVGSQCAAEKQKKVWEAKGYQVEIRPMHGGTYAVLGTKRGANPKRSRRRNQPDEQTDAASETDQAVRLFQTFHGKEPAEILELQRSAAVRLDYTALGDLRAIGIRECPFDDQELVHKWEQCPHIDFSEDAIKLASAPNGNQIYLIGGNQDLSMSLEDFEGIDPTKDVIDFGDATFVVYDARKKHSNFEPIEWVHKFGGEDDEKRFGPPVLPRLLYDRLKQEIFLAGGEYYIDDTTKLSPGIEN